MGVSKPISQPPSGARIRWRLVFIAIITAAFARSLISLAVYAAGSELDSYILLIPLISAYFIFFQGKSSSAEFESSPGFAAIPGALACTALLAASHWRPFLSHNDSLTLVTFAFVCSICAGAFLVLGRKWVAGAAFPLAFLLFMAPLPDAVVNALETASKLASADAAAVFFDIFSVPALRSGVVFQLPNITIQVAQECSGIHSSLILVITSLLASHLMLRSFWRRSALIAFAIPLGVIRNGFRILVLGWLCTNVGPRMIDSPIHHKGGPIFFVLSLIPFFLLLWVLCRGDRKRIAKEGARRDPHELPACN